MAEVPFGLCKQSFFEVISAQVQKGAAAAYCVGGGIAVDLFGGVPPSRACIRQRRYTLQRQCAENESKHGTQHVNAAWFEACQDYGRQPW